MGILSFLTRYLQPEHKVPKTPAEREEEEEEAEVEELVALDII